MTDDEWKLVFMDLSDTLSKKFKSICQYVDVFNEAYVFLLEYYVKHGIILPNKDDEQNTRCFYVSAKRHIMRQFNKHKRRQTYETMTEFDEDLDQDIIDKNTENFLDNFFDNETDIPIKINKLLNSEHKENRQIGLFAKCLLDSQKSGLSRKEAIEVTQQIMDIGIARFYELQNKLAEYLEYNSGKYKRKLSK